LPIDPGASSRPVCRRSGPCCQSGPQDGGGRRQASTCTRGLTEIGNAWRCGVRRSGAATASGGLQFDVPRGPTRAPMPRATAVRPRRPRGFVEERTIAECRNLIRAAFRQPASGAGDPAGPGVAKRLEQATGMGRLEWPSSLMRAFLGDVDGSRGGPGGSGSSTRPAWLSLAGFCLRPRLRSGRGRLAGRPNSWAALPPAGVQFPEETSCAARSGGSSGRRPGRRLLRPGSRRCLADPLVADWRNVASAKSGKRRPWPLAELPVRPPTNPPRGLAAARVTGNCSSSGQRRSNSGRMLMERPRPGEGRGPCGMRIFCSRFGRVGGARVPVYGPLKHAGGCADRGGVGSADLMQANPPGREGGRSPRCSSPAGSGDRYRDVIGCGASVRAQVGLEDRDRRRPFAGAGPRGRTIFARGGAAQRLRARSLPRGLRIE